MIRKRALLGLMSTPSAMRDRFEQQQAAVSERDTASKRKAVPKLAAKGSKARGWKMRSKGLLLSQKVNTMDTMFNTIG